MKTPRTPLLNSSITERTLELVLWKVHRPPLTLLRKSSRRTPMALLKLKRLCLKTMKLAQNISLPRRNTMIFQLLDKDFKIRSMKRTKNSFHS